VVSEGILKLKTLPFELDIKEVYLNVEFLTPSVPTL
jgi:hypothetical protein